ncbi:MAG: sugar phosphate isomerase/epimerase family protein [Candidatus Micrarchaeota archaeon]
MKLGSMTYFAADPAKELQRIHESGFDYVELNIEWPSSTAEKLLARKSELKKLISDYKLEVVGHTPWYFHFAHPYSNIRSTYIEETKKIMNCASEFGAKICTIHPDQLFHIYDEQKDREGYVRNFLDSAKTLDEHARSLGLTLCVENFHSKAFSIEEFKRLFREIPKAKLTLDLGHTNFFIPGADGASLFLDEFSSKLAHVHAHDNNGKEDQHLSIGEGKIDWKKTLGKLKKVYNGTITLEIHAPDRDYIKISKKKFEELWKSV